MPSPLKKIINYFHFNRTEQRGLSILFVLLAVIVGFNLLMPLIFKPANSDISEFEKEIEKFTQIQQAAKDSLMRLSDELATQKAQDEAGHIKPFRFNPNNLPRETWKKLGLSDQQIDVIKNYEEKGGTFKSKEDVARIYSISEDEYNRLKPYIVIPKPFETEIEGTLLTPIPFDPNTTSREDLIAMGLSERVIDNIINYRDKGGHFDNADDFGKLYALSKEDFETLKPFIQIEKQILPFEEQTGESLVMIELNSADTLDLQQLSGIGPAFARRIVKYREMLGGYTNKEQLLEVYGMDSVKYVTIAANISVDQHQIHKININSASVKELINHPYIEFYLAKSIITYRDNIGNYQNIDELLNAKLIYQELYLKIAPYLTLKEQDK